MPTATDLVTDLPADFEVFGQAVATSMADLLGGTTGQVLSKTTNADMDFTWINNDQGDITGVTAGTGISGGGTSGTVTITNSMATAIDAKGDLIGGTGADTFARLAVGTNGTVLTADSTEATGMKWATGSASAKAVGLYKSGSQSTSNATFTAILFDSEDFDTSGFHSIVTNTSRITIPAGAAGYYQINGAARWADNTTGVRVTAIYKNGSLWVRNLSTANVGSGSINIIVPIIMNLAESDYIEVFAYQNSGGSLDVVGNNIETRATSFTVAYLGA